MGGRRLRTVGDAARQGLMASVKCQKCGHEASVKLSGLILHLGVSRSIGSLRFRCRGCGSREVEWDLVEGEASQRSHHWRDAFRPGEQDG